MSIYLFHGVSEDLDCDVWGTSIEAVKQSFLTAAKENEFYDTFDVYITSHVYHNDFATPASSNGGYSLSQHGILTSANFTVKGRNKNE